MAKGEYITAQLPCFGIYIVGNGGLTYGYSTLLFAYTNMGISNIAGDEGAFIIEVENYETRTIKITNNVNIALKVGLYSLY